MYPATSGRYHAGYGIIMHRASSTAGGGIGVCVVSSTLPSLVPQALATKLSALFLAVFSEGGSVRCSHGSCAGVPIAYLSLHRATDVQDMADTGHPSKDDRVSAGDGGKSDPPLLRPIENDNNGADLSGTTKEPPTTYALPGTASNTDTDTDADADGATDSTDDVDYMIYTEYIECLEFHQHEVEQFDELSIQDDMSPTVSRLLSRMSFEGRRAGAGVAVEVDTPCRVVCFDAMG